MRYHSTVENKKSSLIKLIGLLQDTLNLRLKKLMMSTSRSTVLTTLT